MYFEYFFPTFLNYMTVNYVSPKNKKIKTTKVQQQKNPTNNTSQININNLYFPTEFFKIRSVWHIIVMMALSSVSILPTVVLNVLILKPAMHTKSLGCQERQQPWILSWLYCTFRIGLSRESVLIMITASVFWHLYRKKRTWILSDFS